MSRSRYLGGTRCLRNVARHSTIKHHISEDLSPQNGKRLSQKLQMNNFSHVCYTITTQNGKRLSQKLQMNTFCHVCYTITTLEWKTS